MNCVDLGAISLHISKFSFTSSEDLVGNDIQIIHTYLRLTNLQKINQVSVWYY